MSNIYVIFKERRRWKIMHFLRRRTARSTGEAPLKNNEDKESILHKWKKIFSILRSLGCDFSESISSLRISNKFDKTPLLMLDVVRTCRTRSSNIIWKKYKNDNERTRGSIIITRQILTSLQERSAVSLSRLVCCYFILIAHAASGKTSRFTSARVRH